MPQETRGARQSTDPSARVVAMVVNGATYALLSTPNGLMWCQEKYIRKPQRWERTGSLDEMIIRVSRVRDSVEVRVSSDPNVPKPGFDLKFSTRRDFLMSGVKLTTSGSWHVNVTRPQRPHRMASTASAVTQ